MSQTLVFDSASREPVKSLRLIEHDTPQCSPSQVLVKLLAAPINPLDLLVLQGKYPVKPQSFEQGHPIPGYDGVARILECGATTVGLEVGDRVIVNHHGLGTWRTEAIFDYTDVTKVPEDMEIEAAAIVRVGILTAWLLLEKNIGTAVVGDWIIVNAATGAVAHFLMQFAAAKGFELVITESELPSFEVPEGRNIALGFDAVFGASGQKLASRLSSGATYVAYGFLSGSSGIPISQQLIFLKSITFKGFRLSAALATLSKQEELALFSWFAEKLRNGQLTMPMLDTVRWDPKGKYLPLVTAAIKEAQEEGRGRYKFAIVF